MRPLHVGPVLDVSMDNEDDRPHRLSHPSQEVTAGVISTGAAINYLSRFHDDGAELTDFSGRVALDGVIAAGMWIALSRPFGTSGRE
jgi:hypothetical protein